MAKYAPSKEVLQWYEDKLRNHPKLSHVLDNWEHLPFPPMDKDPEWYAPFISREDWGALPAKEGATPLEKIMYIRWTWVGKEDCTNIEECSKFCRDLQKSNMDEGMPDIQFNFLVGAKGIIYEGRGWNWEADREERHNNFEGLHGKLKGQTVDVAYIGDMSFYGPTNDVQMGAFAFMQKSIRQGHIDLMFESIPFRERPSDTFSPDAYWKESDLPEDIRRQIREKEANALASEQAEEQPQPPVEN